MEVPVDLLDFPPCMDHVALLSKIEGVTVETENGPLRLVLPAYMEISEAHEEIRKVQEQATKDYLEGGEFRAPSNYTEFAYNLHVLLHVHAEIGVLSLSTEYAVHFGHQFPVDQFLPPRTSLSGGLGFFGVAIIKTEEGKESICLPKLPAETTYREICDILANNPPPPTDRPLEQDDHDLYDDEPDFKRRRVMADVDEDILESTLKAVHALLLDLSESDENRGVDDVDVPIRGLDEEFETRWKVRFDPQAFGVSSILQFLKKFPKVFSVLNNGVEMVVRPQPAPIFDVPEEGGVSTGPSSFLTLRPFTLGAATRLAGICVNLVAESAAENTEFEDKFASYEQVQQLIDVFMEGKSATEEISAVASLQDVTKPDPDKVTAAPKGRPQKGL
eukprot:GEMP01069326.1.p1 GENE.GEMP01069326.1~~GEMP01069326.1.p1  ORF type:complete len:389 (-),score=101.13 GEMP01069326.1:55-1221(-)